jgi:hypothetical protein
MEIQYFAVQEAAVGRLMVAEEDSGVLASLRLSKVFEFV